MQARAGAAGLPAPSGQAALPEETARRSAFARLGAVEEMHLTIDDGRGASIEPNFTRQASFFAG